MIEIWLSGKDKYMRGLFFCTVLLFASKLSAQVLEGKIKVACIGANRGIIVVQGPFLKNILKMRKLILH